MKAILRQAIANLRGHKLQAALIFTVLFASSTLLTVAFNTLHTAQGAFERLFEKSHAPHLWLLLDPLALPREETERMLAELPGVDETSRAYRTISTTMFFGDLCESGPAMRDWPEPSDAVGRPVIVEGRSPDPGETDVIVLDRNAAVDYQVEVDDTIGVLTPTGRRDLTVAGLFVSTEVCPTCFPFITYVAPGTMADLGLLTSWDQDEGALDIGLRLVDPAETQAVLQAATEALPEDSVWGWDQWQDLRSYADSSTQLQSILLLTFSGVAVVAAGLLMASAIRGTVRTQTRQMGLLKAIGFTGGQLAWIYLAEYLALALAASLAGLIAGSMIAVLTLKSISMMFGDNLARPAAWILLATPLVTLLATTLFTSSALRRAVRMDVVQAIRTGSERPRSRRSSLGGGVLRRLPLPLLMGMREVMAQPGRALLMVIGLGTAVLTMVSGFTITSTLQAILSDPAQLGFEGDVSIRRSEYISEEAVRQLIDAQPEVASYYSERWRSFHFPGENVYYHARFREGDLDDFRFPVVEGRMFERHGEALAGYGMMTSRGLQIGDTVDILINDYPFSIEIVGLYRENSNNGRMMVFPSETLRLVMPDFETFTFVIKLEPGSDPKAVADRFTEASNSLVDARTIGIGALPGNVASLPGIMTALTLVLAVIAGLGVSNIAWMTVQEHRREYGILKSVGMTPAQVVLSVLAGVSAMAVAAYMVGLPAGLMGIRALMNTVAISIGFGPLSLWTSVIGIVLLLPGIALLAMLGAFIPAYRAGRTSPIEVLRYE
ncbi:MAG: ABC transporter permease [Anaerolineales bacterium]|jgi:putative ABC transport system permease protein